MLTSEGALPWDFINKEISYLIIENLTQLTLASFSIKASHVFLWTSSKSFRSTFNHSTTFSCFLDKLKKQRDKIIKRIMQIKYLLKI